MMFPESVIDSGPRLSTSAFSFFLQEEETGKEGVGLCVKDRMHCYSNADTFVANGKERTVYTIGS